MKTEIGRRGNTVRTQTLIARIVFGTRIGIVTGKKIGIGVIERKEERRRTDLRDIVQSKTLRCVIIYGYLYS